MSKDKKQTPQQACNQFIFTTMMDKLRAVELYEKEVSGYSKQITQHIKDHRENAAKVEPIINDLIKKVEKLEGQLNFKLNDGPIANHRKRIYDIEIEIKDMREDYHAHFRGLRGDEIKTLIDKTDVLVRDVDALQIRLSRAQDMIAEMHKDGFIYRSGVMRGTGRPLPLGRG